MGEESLLPVDPTTIARKRVSAAFDGGRIAWAVGWCCRRKRSADRASPMTTQTISTSRAVVRRSSSPVNA